MHNPYDFLKPEEIAAITLLEKNGFECFVSSRIGPARHLKNGHRVPGMNGGKRFDLALGIRSLTDREGKGQKGKDKAEEEKAEEENDPESMNRGQLIDAVAQIPGIGNPSRMKTSILKEILTKYQAGTLNPSDYE